LDNLAGRWRAAALLNERREYAGGVRLTDVHGHVISDVLA
jgi:hypothetical protein